MFYRFFVPVCFWIFRAKRKEYAFSGKPPKVMRKYRFLFSSHDCCVSIRSIIYLEKYEKISPDFSPDIHNTVVYTRATRPCPSSSQ